MKSVSRWQGDIDWARVANSGITFAMIKCGGGDDGLYEDRKFQQNIQGALANGIQVGIYFYSGAMVNVFLQWQKNGKNITPEELAGIITDYRRIS